MHFSRSLALTAAILAGHAVEALQCESAEKVCYTRPYNTPQNLTIEGIHAVASYLRAYGAETTPGRQYTMTAEGAPGCVQWQLYDNGAVRAIAEHHNPVIDSSVFYSDIADTIDGGVNATAEQQEASLLGCGTAGGSIGVLYDAKDPQYQSAAYKASGYLPSGILIKLVESQS